MSAQCYKGDSDPESPRMSTKSSLSVLIVDDQKASRDSIRDVLTLFPILKLAGEVETGEQAVEFVDSLCPDLVLMDLSLPGMNGIEATRLLKGNHPEVIVFIITANPPEGYREAAFTAGASEYITKSQIRKGLSKALSGRQVGSVKL